jgi:bifunctional polynucleotide phosphatase/kinase
MNPESRIMLPRQAFTGFAARYSPPTLNEGFVDITQVDFEVRCRSIPSRVPAWQES